MRDFILDFRENQRISAKDANYLKFYDETEIELFEYKKFTLALTRCSEADIWNPVVSDDRQLLAAVCGNIALDRAQWEQAGAFEKSEGAASTWILKTYSTEGMTGLSKKLNGNYIVLIFDGSTNAFYLITDRWGMVPGFRHTGINGLFSSHPDVLARIGADHRELDYASLTEFFVTGKLTCPHTYYKNIESLEYGAIYEFDLGNSSIKNKAPKKYFEFTFDVEHPAKEWELAEELAGAFRESVLRRTLPLFGTIAFSLSGGLDSRTLLCAAEDKEKILAFSFYDEENLEFNTAKAIAKEAGVEFIPLKRNFEHYGDYAREGIKISGGMGSLGNNHFLGFRNRFRELGFDNILTGFYCDYMFKALVLDHKETALSRKEIFSSFKYENYQKYTWIESVYGKDVEARLHSLFPDSLTSDTSETARQIIAHNRFYPLCYEPDNLETTIPQRVMNFYLPTIDNAIIDVYQKIKPSYKLNTSMFKKMVRHVCGKKVCAIIDTNTGVKVGASRLRIAWSRYRSALRRKLEKGKKYSEGSWPNWEYYRKNSGTIASLMDLQKKETKEVLTHLFGTDELSHLCNNYKTVHIKRFLRFLTLKIWLDINL